MKPYAEKKLNEVTRIRKFSSTTPEDHLIWHRDRQDRVVEVIGGKGWMFQRDGSIPVQISQGTIFEVSANEWHRIIKGDGDLIVKITEGKKKKNKKLSRKQKKIAQAAPPPDEITGADFKALRKKSVAESDAEIPEGNDELDIFESLSLLYEKKKRKKRKKKKSSKDKSLPRQYSAPKGSKREKLLKKASALYKKGDVKGAAAVRQRMEEPHLAESEIIIHKSVLLEMINDALEEEKLDIVLQELEDRLDEKKKKSGKSSKGLSKAVKKSLDKKADKRCLTRGSVYAEFRKGLSAFLSSGSRKGMTAHQWAHARVNSANARKKWAVVKKRKKCPKKKK